MIRSRLQAWISSWKKDHRITLPLWILQKAKTPILKKYNPEMSIKILSRFSTLLQQKKYICYSLLSQEYLHINLLHMRWCLKSKLKTSSLCWTMKQRQFQRSEVMDRYALEWYLFWVIQLETKRASCNYLRVS